VDDRFAFTELDVFPPVAVNNNSCIWTVGNDTYDFTPLRRDR
jgi:hypothetical protein